MKQSQQINQRRTTCVRIDAEWAYTAKVEATRQGRTLKSLIEDSLAEYIGEVCTDGGNK